jgi:AbrB family looped-hinge helix DNA binding protein
MAIGSVGPKGQVVIPKDMRDRLGIRPGSKVRIALDEDGEVVQIRPGWDDPIRDGPAVIQRHFRRATPGDKSLSETLLDLRREDDRLWEAQFERWMRTRSSSTRMPSRRTSAANKAHERSPRS